MIAHPLGIQPVSRDRGKDQDQTTKGVKPSGLVKMRFQQELNGRRFLVPNATVIRCNYAKHILPRRKVRIVRGPAQACVNPVTVIAFELILEPDSGGDLKTQGCEMNINFVI